MKFTVVYTGELKSNANASEKNRLRLQLQPQLKRAAQQTRSFKKVANSSESQAWSIARHRANQEGAPDGFLPIAMPGQYGPDPWYSSTASVELDITLIKAGPIGAIIDGGGDIDNRLKTLFDALQVPDANQIASLNIVVPPTDIPIVCLMMDDKQISRVNVKTAQRLDVADDSKEVILIIESQIEQNGLFRL